MDNMRKEVKIFFKKNKIKSKKITLSELKRIIISQGFEIIYFKRSANTSNVKTLLEKLNLKDLSMYKTGFSSVDENYKLVFVLANMTEEDEVFVLLHEEYHILKEHVFKNGIIFNSEVQKEKACAEFTYHALNYKQNRLMLLKKQILSAVAAFIVAAFIFSNIRLSTINPTNEPNTTENDVIETTTEKVTQISDDAVFAIRGRVIYHRAECSHIEGKTDLIELSIEDANDAGYTPCKNCLPDK